MKKINIFILLCVLSLVYAKAQSHKSVEFCNPIDLNYRFQITPGANSYREGADPTMYWFRDRYYLFVSMSGGYWHSKDMATWQFVQTDEIPTEEYAPTVIDINDTLYFLASSAKKSTIYKSTDPLSGHWNVAAEELDNPVWDPAFLYDDGHLFLYYGVMNYLKGVELDYHHGFKFINEPKILITSNRYDNGWEMPGDHNELFKKASFIEGCWLNKYNGKYYFQYACPGTEFKSYCDGVYISDSPLGHYTIQAHNPFDSKPEGFICGGGHGSTFPDKYGNYWHIGTLSISVKHHFERRIGMWPVFFDTDGTMYSNTSFGDYPHELPKCKLVSPNDYNPTGMLLSYNKPVEVSSEMAEHKKINAVDEEVRDYWSAISGKDEWLMVDLQHKCKVNGVQVNLAEEGVILKGRTKPFYCQYLLEYSNDKKHWKTMADETKNTSDHPHSYFQIKRPIEARYIRLTCFKITEGNFAVSGLRVFGKGYGNPPADAVHFTAARNFKDPRQATLQWKKQHDVTGYMIRYGTTPDKLYQSYQVYDTDSIVIRNLGRTQNYYFTIDSFNENGITRGTDIIKAG